MKNNYSEDEETKSRVSKKTIQQMMLLTFSKNSSPAKLSTSIFVYHLLFNTLSMCFLDILQL